MQPSHTQTTLLRSLPFDVPHRSYLCTNVTSADTQCTCFICVYLFDWQVYLRVYHSRSNRFAVRFLAKSDFASLQQVVHPQARCLWPKCISSHYPTYNTHRRNGILPQKRQEKDRTSLGTCLRFCVTNLTRAPLRVLRELTLGDMQKQLSVAVKSSAKRTVHCMTLFDNNTLNGSVWKQAPDCRNEPGLRVKQSERGNDK